MRTAVYPASRMYYERVLPSVKSLLCNSDVDQVVLTIEDDEYPGQLPECVKTVNAQKVFGGYFSGDGPNIVRTPYVYLCMARVVYAGVLRTLGLVPEGDGRVLALDADTLVMKDIGSEPWEMDLGDAEIGGVPEVKISQEIGRPYVNAGVLLMDLDRIRERGLDVVMCQELDRTYWQWLEQDVINTFCKVKPLGAEWNACQFTQTHGCADVSGWVKIRHWAYEVGGWCANMEVERYRQMSWEEVMKRWKSRR